MTTYSQALHHLTIHEASELIRSRQLSPVELTQAFLDRIEAIDDRLKSYITLLPEAAMEAARAAEGEISRGNYRGPLHGIPIALKDLYDTAGVPTMAQSKVLEHRVPDNDATVVTRLREAGTVLLGKLTMHEFALGFPASLYESPRNPWNLDHVTGGSSSGSGAGIAAGTCMGTLGSCTGGSIRGPASYCGIVGLKPTYGRVSRHGVLPLSWSLDHVGPMTWTVEDTAHIMQAIAGHDPDDATSSRSPVPDYASALREDVNGLVIGVPRHYFFDAGAGADPEILAAVEKALADLESLGARLEEVTIPSLDLAGPANWLIMMSEAFAYHKDNLQSQPQNFGSVVRHRFYLGGLFGSADYVKAQQARSRIRREFAEVMQRVDLIGCPTMLGPAPLFDSFDPSTVVLGRSFTAPFNETGMPAISVPCGFTESGLPLGLQLAGRPFEEETVIRAAYTYQQHAGWYKQRPAI